LGVRLSLPLGEGPGEAAKEKNDETINDRNRG
jgi:hypothetical protein